jgi:hypothetical protein
MQPLLSAPDAVHDVRGLVRGPLAQRAPGRGAVAKCQAVSTKTRRVCVLPALVIAPRRWAFLEGDSLGPGPGRP